MRCPLHPETSTELLCAKCGQGICPECQTLSGNPELCPTCRWEEIEETNRVRRLQDEHIGATIVLMVLTILALAFLPDTDLGFRNVKACWIGCLLVSIIKSFLFSRFRDYRLGILTSVLPFAYLAGWVFPNLDFPSLMWLGFLLPVFPMILIYRTFRERTADQRREYRSLRGFMRSLPKN